ncbi:hypothetical protein BH20ACT2_BH20ACT2_25620 [soil metagenome]
MISFRFHIMSLVAVFLAVALGVVVGSTYVDRAVVTSLENRIDTVSGNLDERLADNDRLSGQLDRLETYAAASAPFAVSGRLVDVPVLVLAERGVDEDQVEELVVLLDNSGAFAPGILWFEAKWALAEPADREQLGDALGVDAVSPSARRASAWRMAVEELARTDPEPDGEDGATGDADPTSTTTLPGEVPSPDGSLPGEDSGEAPAEEGEEPIEPAPAPTLESLIELGFLSFQAVGGGEATVLDLAGSGPRVLYASRGESEVGVEDLVSQMTDILVAGSLPTVVDEINPDDTDTDQLREPDPVTSQIRDDARLRGLVSTVDAGRLEQGRVAAVLALADLAGGLVGHYGYAPGSNRILPEWSAL